LLLAVPAIAEVLSEPPTAPDPARYYLFYSHGQIVEGSDGRPVSPEFGPYDYRAILERLSERGFVVISTIRPAGSQIEASAAALRTQVQQLLDAGVAPDHVVVVGVSKGGLIAIRASHLLANPQLRFVIIAGLFASFAGKPDYLPYGRVLSIHDASDAHDIRPDPFLSDPARVPSSQVLVTHTGLGHGLSYRPREEWISPLVDWSGLEATPARSR